MTRRRSGPRDRGCSPWCWRAVAVVDLLLKGAVVVVLHIGGGVVLPIDGDGGGAALEEIAVPDQKADAEQDHQNGKHRVDDVVDMGLTLLLLLLELLFTETLTARSWRVFFSRDALTVCSVLSFSWQCA